MTKLSITASSKMAGISRQTMYKRYINTNKISVEVVNGVKLIDTSELIRVFGELQPADVKDLQHTTSDNQQIDSVKDEIISMLKEQINEFKQREQENKEREKWLMDQLEKTTHLLEDKTVKKRKKFLGLF